jgi:hypothetical protein
MLQRASDWADMLEREGLVKLSSYRGKAGIVSLLPRLASETPGWSASTTTSNPPTCSSGAGSSSAAHHAPSPTVEAALGAELKHGNAIHEFPNRC